MDRLYRSRLRQRPKTSEPAKVARRNVPHVSRPGSARPSALVIVILLVTLLAVGVRTAHAQLGALTGGASSGHTINSNEPVTFSADEVDYDKDKSLVTATGHVEAWQNGHIMRADRITFDRNTGVAAATGHVVMLEPDG